VAFSPDGEWILTGSSDGTAKVWQSASGKELLTLNHNAVVDAVAFSPDGKRILTGGRDQVTKVWDSVSGKELLPTLKGHTGGILTVAFSPDGHRIVTGSYDETARVWDAARGEELFALSGHNGWVFSAAFSPDGRRIATCNRDGTSKIWDALNGKELLTFNGHSNVVVCGAFSPGGEQIVTGSSDRTAKVWEPATGKELVTLKGHRDQIWGVAFSADGQRIVTGSADGTAKVWDAASGNELLTLKGHNSPVRSVAFSPDGSRIVTGSFDATAKIWQAATPQQVAVWQKEETEAEAEPENLRRARDAYLLLHGREPGVITQWLVLAPIPLHVATHQAALEALDQEQIPHESDLRVRAGEHFNARGRECVWKALQLQDYLTDFNNLLGKQTEWSVAYAVCYIQSYMRRANLVMKVGSDDEAKVYLNGKRVYQSEVPRPYSPDQDDTEGIELKAGLNVLVFKVVNELGDWLGSIRFTDAAGQPVKGIQVTLTSP
jgi:hypothetical protein